MFLVLKIMFMSCNSESELVILHLKFFVFFNDPLNGESDLSGKVLNLFDSDQSISENLSNMTEFYF